ncbi:MAG: TetR/AcrR family transcriptional regulator [Eubacterium sp.]
MITLSSKAQLIKSAKKLFFAHGYKETTNRMIAEDCAINSGLITYYFKNKKNLAKLVLIDNFEETISQITSIYGGDDPLVIFLIFQRINCFSYETRENFSDFILETMNFNILEEACFECSYMELLIDIVKKYYYQHNYSAVTAAGLFFCQIQAPHTRIFVLIRSKKLQITYMEHYHLLVENIFELLNISSDNRETMMKTVEMNALKVISEYSE